MIVRRLVQGDDLEGAIGLMQCFFREEGFTTPETVISANVSHMVNIAQCGLFVAEEGDATIGIASVSMEFGIEFGWSGEMGDLYVLPIHRGRGVAGALMQEVEVFLRSKDATSYQVTVTPDAQQAHGIVAFYRKLGFLGEGRQILSKSI